MHLPTIVLYWPIEHSVSFSGDCLPFVITVQLRAEVP